jgi:hypothetical protein
MAGFRQLKTRFSAICASPDWASSLDVLPMDSRSLKEAVSPLLALLPRSEYRFQAAYGLGVAVSRLACVDLEGARVIMRRLMWSLNEESGNLGWGVPEAMGAILAMSPILAGEYAGIFLSYGYETGREDNFIDHAPLRCGVYLGAAMLAAANFAAARPLLPHLAKALAAPEAVIRVAAALVLRQLAVAASAVEFSGSARADWEQALAAVREAAAGQGTDVQLEYYEGGSIVSVAGAVLFSQAAEAVEEGMRLSRESFS